MHCPFCNAFDTKVIDSRLVAEGNQVRRRRECLTCNERFTTYESAELVMPRIIKHNGDREPFDEEKLHSGLIKALEKRPVSIEKVDEAISRIKNKLRATGECVNCVIWMRSPMSGLLLCTRASSRWTSLPGKLMS